MSEVPPYRPLWGCMLRKSDWMGLVPQPPMQLTEDHIIQVTVGEQVVVVLYLKLNQKVELPSAEEFARFEHASIAH